MFTILWQDTIITLQSKSRKFYGVIIRDVMVKNDVWVEIYIFRLGWCKTEWKRCSHTFPHHNTPGNCTSKHVCCVTKSRTQESSKSGMGKLFSRRAALTSQELTEGQYLTFCNSCIQYKRLKLLKM